MQVTHHQLDQMREAEASARAAEAKERELAAKREVSADSYTKLVDTENINRVEDAGGQVLETAAASCVVQGLFILVSVSHSVVCTARCQLYHLGSGSAVPVLVSIRRADKKGVYLCCDAVEARSMEQAIDALQSLAVGVESPAVDKHPEKYVHVPSSSICTLPSTMQFPVQLHVESTAQCCMVRCRVLACYGTLLSTCMLGSCTTMEAENPVC
jgi:hypothetical protein